MCWMLFGARKKIVPYDQSEPNANKVMKGQQVEQQFEAVVILVQIRDVLC